jgi:hypothetical protein
MSEELPLVSQVMHLREGEVEPSDEAKVERLERKLSEWKRDVVRAGKKMPTPSREDMASNMVDVENNLEGYWCKREKCMNSRTHWVLHSSCWDCWHDPCACLAPLVWDEVEQMYHHFFCHAGAKRKNNFWLSEATSDLTRISFKRREEKKETAGNKGKKRKSAPTINRLPKTKGSVATTMQSDYN